MTTPAFELTADQKSAFNAFSQFLLDNTQSVFVLRGYAGTGKTTLVKYLLERLPGIMNMIQVIEPGFKGWDIRLTATTNKACEALRDVAHTGYDVTTLHSFLGLTVRKNYETGEMETIVKNPKDIKSGMLIFIDEASFIDHQILKKIFALTKNCKIVFMGDPAQLTMVNCKTTPVFSSGFPTASLTQVVRQAKGNPIIDVATSFRETVNTGEWFSFRPDGEHLIWVDRDDWDKAIRAEFTRPGRGHNDARVLAWTNACVISYNHAIRDMVQGDPNFQEGDYAIVNQHIGYAGSSLKTDQDVQITYLDSIKTLHGIRGRLVSLNEKEPRLFLPISLEEKKAAYKTAKADSNYGEMRWIDENCIDLRQAFACTVNKSQGSTYDTVFIDLDNIKGCNNANTIARMMYVAVSRARKRAYFTGDLV